LKVDGGVGLGQLQPFHLYVVAADLRKFVLSLLHKPAVFRASEHFGQPNGHLGGNPALSIHQFRKRVARDAEASAASVTVKPKGSMHCRRTTPPGCGGFFMVMGCSFPW
jgi:hypothetical protein